MERPRPDILASLENYHVSPSNLLDHLPGDLYRDPQSPEFATDEGSTSPENTQKVIQAIGKSPILLSPLDMWYMIIAKANTALLIPRKQ